LAYRVFPTTLTDTINDELCPCKKLPKVPVVMVLVDVAGITEEAIPDRESVKLALYELHVGSHQYNIVG